MPPIFASGGHDDAGVPSADVRTDPGQCGRPVRPGAGHARLRPPVRPVRTPARAAARRDRPRHPGRVRARGHAVRPVRRPADHAGRGPADGGRDAWAGPGGQLPGPARRPARVRGRLRRAVDRRAVLAGRRRGRTAGPGRVGGQRRRGRRGRARYLRRAHRAPRAGRPAAGRGRGLRRDHRRARRAPGPRLYRRVPPCCSGRAAGGGPGPRRHRRRRRGGDSRPEHRGLRPARPGPAAPGRGLLRADRPGLCRGRDLVRGRQRADHRGQAGGR